jgi:NAD(P)-dependent dehydrogenase (short-subunit alcohol dehydrogenase family)
MKHIIISGANGSLGSAVADKFLHEGFLVSGIVRSLKKSEDNTNINLKLIDVDLSDEAAVAKMVDDAVKQHGKIDVAVLTAGGFAMGDIKNSSSADILNQYKLNFETAYHLARPVFLQMLQQGFGRIFFIGGRPGIDASKSKGMTGYGFSKSLVIRLSELINEEARGTDVVSTVVIPGVIDTAPNRDAMPDDDFSKWVKPSEIADIIYRHTTPEMNVLRETVLKVYGKS